MKEITVAYHFIIPVLLSCFALMVLIKQKPDLYPKWKWTWISTSIFFSINLFIVGGAASSDIYAQWYLNKYDLNQDGFFSGTEITREMNEAMSYVSNDVGRNFSFITGLIFSGIISCIIFIGGHSIEFIMLRKRH